MPLRSALLNFICVIINFANVIKFHSISIFFCSNVCWRPKSLGHKILLSQPEKGQQTCLHQRAYLLLHVWKIVSYFIAAIMQKTVFSFGYALTFSDAWFCMQMLVSKETSPISLKVNCCTWYSNFNWDSNSNLNSKHTHTDKHLPF